MAGVVAERHRPIGAFNPAWCLRPQTSGRVAVGRWEYGPPASTSTSSSSLCSSRANRIRGAAEPQSPRVGCMGQIKGDKAAGGGSSSPALGIRLLKLWKIFAGKNVFGVAEAVSPRVVRAKSRLRDGAAARICIAELDPPLPPPVVKRAAGEANPVCLWRRRRRKCEEGLALGSLQLQPQRPPPPCVYLQAAA